MLNGLVMVTILLELGFTSCLCQDKSVSRTQFRDCIVCKISLFNTCFTSRVIHQKDRNCHGGCEIDGHFIPTIIRYNK